MISAAVNGIESKCVLVEADVSDGLPMFSMVGYLASEVREAQDRVDVYKRQMANRAMLRQFLSLVS